MNIRNERMKIYIREKLHLYIFLAVCVTLLVAILFELFKWYR